MTNGTGQKPNLYALLIGVDFYFEYPLPDGSYYPTLGGCVRDVQGMESYLTTFLKLPANNIYKLTSTPGLKKPKEPPEQWPTYENMVAKFQQVTQAARPGDFVYVHYSGHGGRAVTIYPDLKGPDGLDEALVPIDIGAPNARYLRDVEIHKLIQDMVDKGIVLTVVFDSCHSGGATRASTTGVPGAVKRGIATIDTAHRPTESLVASPDALAAAWMGPAGGAGRAAAQPASSWLLEPKGYTLLAACRASESANEWGFGGSQRNGALTYWLLDTLHQASGDVTYKMLADRIVAKVSSQFEDQTPMLQGEGDLRIFGSDRIPSHYAVPVIQVDASRQRVQLGAGEAQGLGPGAQFAIFPSAASDFSQGEDRVAQVELTQVAAVQAWAQIREQKPGTTIETGAQAVLLNASQVQLQRGVLVPIDDAGLKAKIEAAIDSEGKGFIVKAGSGVRVDFQVTVNTAGELQIEDPADTPIPNLRPAVLATDPDGPSKIVKRLVHLTKYRNVQELDMPDMAMRARLQVSLEGQAAGGAGPTDTPVFRPGDTVTLKITNAQQPNPRDPNDPARILNVAVLDLGSDWSITQIYPSGAGAFQDVDPGETIPLTFEAYLPQDYTESTDVLKVFATRATTDFRWLELPALDQAPKAATKGLATDPLEQLLAAVTADQANARALTLVAAPQPDRGWTVSQLKLTVKQA